MHESDKTLLIFFTAVHVAKAGHCLFSMVVQYAHPYQFTQKSNLRCSDIVP